MINRYWDLGSRDRKEPSKGARRPPVAVPRRSWFAAASKNDGIESLVYSRARSRDLATLDRDDATLARRPVPTSTPLPRRLIALAAGGGCLLVLAATAGAPRLSTGRTELPPLPSKPLDAAMALAIPARFLPPAAVIVVPERSGLGATEAKTTEAASPSRPPAPVERRQPPPRPIPSTVAPPRPLVDASRSGRVASNAPVPQSPVPPVIAPPLTAAITPPEPTAPIIPVSRPVAPPVAPPLVSTEPAPVPAASPDPPPPASPAVTEAPIAQGSAAQQEVFRVVQAYSQAMGTMEVSALESLGPGVDLDELARARRDVLSQTITFRQCELTMATARALVRCSGVVTYIPRQGGSEPRVRTGRWTFDLAQTGGRWLIRRVTKAGAQ
jgi:hypothetical protein